MTSQVKGHAFWGSLSGDYAEASTELDQATDFHRGAATTVDASA